MSFLLAGVLVGCSQKDIGNVSNDTLQTKQSAENEGRTETIIHESADILYFENGYPYIHDILTNNTEPL